ncbi:hypothetical protein IB270_33655 [Ensifer sp. ENS05]|uniref:hypothetical protein n=1 Tax=Ensifer sp. ENS05 TaxID=2769277 RepID=UPI001782B3B1|nr:hypothetical protein [Ensifer sp. ENS05]MBD9597772.1 hypothetical protein [Ensifer sp. ENS05]
MLITELEVRRIFERLIGGEIDREAADMWAYEKVQAFDRDDLIFEPRDIEEKLWSSVLYLHGVDMQTSPTQYLHSNVDIEKKFQSLWPKT